MAIMNVGELARIAGVSVRTLHHYDEIGLLPPSGRTPGGYRTYDDADVDRLRSILTYRELGLGLNEIAEAIEPGTDAHGVLRRASRRVEEKIRRLEAIRSSLETAIRESEKGTTMTPEQKLAVFGGFDPDEHAAEAHERWGDTNAYAESIRRTTTYTVADWERIRDEAADIYRRFLELRDGGVAPDSAEAAAVVDDHRRHISTWYYECSPEIHAALGRMYVADDRFTTNIDRFGEGLAAYMAAAIESTRDSTREGGAAP